MSFDFTEDDWEAHAKENKIIFSSCKECVFKSPDDCYCGRIDKFKEAGASIVDIKEQDGNNKYKVINGRICNMYRTNNWLRAMRISEKPKEDIQKIAREEIRVNCSFVIICVDDKKIRNLKCEKEIRVKSKQKIGSIIKTMKSILSSSIKPDEIVFVNETWIKPYDFINYLRIQCDENNINCKWRLEHFGDMPIEDSSSIRDENIKSTLKTITKGYCSIFFDGEIVSKNHLEKLDEKLNDELQAVLVMKPKRGISSLILNSILFKQFFANKNTYKIEEFIKQVEKVAEEQKCPHLIQQLDQE